VQTFISTRGEPLTPLKLGRTPGPLEGRYLALGGFRRRRLSLRPTVRVEVFALVSRSAADAKTGLVAQAGLI